MTVDRIINWFLGSALIGAAAFIAVNILSTWGAPFFFRFGWI